VTEHGTVPAHQAPTRRLASWQPSTMLDWPGRVATTLSLSGCTYRCPYCRSAALLQPSDAPVDWTDVARHLETRRDWVDGVVVTGGEPTDDPDLPSLLAALKEAGFAVKLDTNGSNPHVLSLLLAEALLDAVSLDIKAVPARYREVSEARNAAADAHECAEMLIGSGLEHEFRTTVYPGLVGLDELTRIARSLRGGRLYALQQFRADGCLDPVALAVAPYGEDELRAAARDCSRFLPTIVRGLSQGED
jgi:pyruvate formate lyase activating enzyme